MRVCRRRNSPRLKSNKHSTLLRLHRLLHGFGRLPEGDTRWTADELLSFVSDCADHGVKAVSFGGGEPLQYPALFEVLHPAEAQPEVGHDVETGEVLASPGAAGGSASHRS